MILFVNRKFNPRLTLDYIFFLQMIYLLDKLNNQLPPMRLDMDRPKGEIDFVNNCFLAASAIIRLFDNRYFQNSINNSASTELNI